jgi:hypothetical protein
MLTGYLDGHHLRNPREVLGTLAKLFKEQIGFSSAEFLSYEQCTISANAEHEATVRAWVDLLCSLMFHRSLFITDSMNSMGLSRGTWGKGTWCAICLDAFCQLRRVDDRYINLGEAYVDGYMTGRGIDELVQGVHTS